MIDGRAGMRRARRVGQAGIILVIALAISACSPFARENPTEEKPDVDLIALEARLAELEHVDSAIVRIASQGMPGSYGLGTKLTLNDDAADQVGSVVVAAIEVVGEAGIHREDIVNYTFTASGPRAIDDPRRVQLDLSRFADVIGGGDYAGSMLGLSREDVSARLADS